MTVQLSLKNCLSFAVGACVVALALITLLVDPQHLSWARWQILVIVSGAVAICALIWQTTIQSKEDIDREERENRRDQAQKDIAIVLAQLTQVAPKGGQETQETNRLEMRQIDP